MQVRLAAGIEADIATPGEVKGIVDAGVGSLLSRIPSPKRGIRRRIPRSYNVIGAAAIGSWVLDFGSPSAGSMWWLVEIVVTAGDQAAAPAGAVASVYCGSVANQQSSTVIQGRPTLGELVRPALALPAVFVFQKETWPVNDNENLSVIIDSTTALSTVSAVATIIELPDSAVYLNRV